MRCHRINLEMLSLQILFKGTTPTNNLVASIENPHPFIIMEMDVQFPFPIAVHKLMFPIITIDYFTIWVEVELLNSIIKRMY